MHPSLEVLCHATPARQEFDTEDYKRETSGKLSVMLGIRQEYFHSNEVLSEVLMGSKTYLSLGMDGTHLIKSKAYRSKDEIKLLCGCAIYCHLS